MAIDDVQWLDASSPTALAFALRRLGGRGHPPASGPPGRAAHPGVGRRACAVDRPRSALARRPAQSRAHCRGSCDRGSAGVFARPTLLRLHEASGGNPFFALELARATIPAGTTSTRLSRCPCRRRWVRSSARASTSCPTKTRRAVDRRGSGAPDGSLLRDREVEGIARAGVRRQRDRARGRGDPVHPPAARLRAVSGRCAREPRRLAHQRLAEIVDDPSRARAHRALAADEPGRGHRRGARGGGRRRDRPRRARSSRRSWGSTPCARHPPAHGGRAPARARRCARPRRCGRGSASSCRSPSSSSRRTGWAGARRGGCSPVRAVEGAQRALALLEEALEDAAGNAALRCCCTGRLGYLGRLTKGMAWAEQHARAAVELAERLGRRRTPRRGALRSRLPPIQRRRRRRSRDGGARYELAVASGDSRTLNGHEVTGSRLFWSVQTERARDLLEA